MSKLYIRACKECRATFSTERKNKCYCSECAARRIKESRKNSPSYNQRGKHKKPQATRKKKKAPALSINQVCKIQKMYNEDNKTVFNYGAIVRMIESGEIEVTITDGVVNYEKK